MPDEDRLDEIRRKLESIEQRLLALEGTFSVAPPTPAALPVSAPPAPSAAEVGGATPDVPRALTARPTLETLIGAHWLNRVGIAALLIGSAFFLKYAFENEWVGPAARVLIGIGSGAALLIWSERFRARGHLTFSHSLKVIAVGILYLSIWAASQTYTLIGNGTAFVGMTIVTGSLVALAIRNQSEFLASVAISCGFLTPLLLSTGENRQLELFAYIVLLDVAALLLSSLYPWVRVLAVAFFGTHVLYISWYARFYSADQMPRTIAFAALFMLLFAVAPLLRRWREPEIASAIVLLLPFANVFVYFTELSWMLQGQSARLALHAMLLAGFFLALHTALRLRGKERPDVAAHLAIAIGFVTIAIPLRFNETWITIGWLVESGALLFLARSQEGLSQRVFRTLGSIALGLGVFRLLFVDDFDPQRAVVNMRALTYALAIVVFAGIAIANSHRREHRAWRFAVFALNVLALIALTREVSDYFNRWGGSSLASRSLARQFSWSALWMLYGAGLMIAGFRARLSFVRWLALWLLGITVAKVFLFDLSALDRVYRILSFIALGVLLLAISFAYQRKWISVPVDEVQL